MKLDHITAVLALTIEGSSAANTNDAAHASAHEKGARLATAVSRLPCEADRGNVESD
jgi:hypothetical protein